MRDFIGLPDLVADHARAMPSSIALSTAQTEITWQELHFRCGRVAASLAAAGVSKGARVCAYVQEPVAFVELLLATLRVSAIFVPLPTNLRVEVLAAILNKCDPAALVVDDASARSVAHAAGARDVIFCDALQSGKAAMKGQCDAGDVASILFSSGTTSTPKGGAHTQGARFATQARFIKRFGLTPACVTVVASPLYTSLTWASLLPTLAAGGKTVFLGQFEPRDFIELSKRQAATFAMMVPTHYAMLASCVDIDEDSFANFDHLISAGAKLDSVLCERMMSLSRGRFVQVLGSTETDAICCLPSRAPREKWGSVGFPLDGVKITVLGDDDQKLERGRTGHIVAHSSSLMVGYYGDEAEAANVFWTDRETNERYYRMGDLGEVDDDGFLWVRGRSNDMIISAGFNLYPADIESVLMEHPSIREAAVVGVPSKPLGQVPLAFVTLVKPDAATSSDLCRWVNARVSDKQRVYAVKIIDRMPQTATGKTQKSALRELSGA